MPFTAMRRKTMRYRVTIKKSYTEISFDFEEMTQASSFAFEALEQTTDEITIMLSVVKEEE